MVSILASGPSSLRFDSQCSPKKFRGKIVDVAGVNQQRCSEESGWWLENDDQTHLVLANCKLVLQKVDITSTFYLPKGTLRHCSLRSKVAHGKAVTLDGNFSSLVLGAMIKSNQHLPFRAKIEVKLNVLPIANMFLKKRRE